MYNHSDIWKNITMIIFYVLVTLLILILILKQTVYLEFCINGLRSKFYVKWGFFKFKRYGNFILKEKHSTKFQKNKIRKTNQKNKTLYQSKIILQSNKKTAKIKSKKSNKNRKFLNKKTERNIKNKNRKNFKIFICILKCLTFEKLNIFEEIGLLAPDKTAFFLPILSSVTTIPLRFLRVRNFDYKIIPKYNELRFYTKVTTKISFRIIDLIYCIIKEFLHKLLYSNNFTRRREYE